MTLQPEDFWSFTYWLLRPDAPIESALLQGVVLAILAILVGLLIGYLVAAVRVGPSEGFYSVARVVRDLVVFDLPGTSSRRIFALSRLAFKEAIRRKILIVAGIFIVGLLISGWYLDPRSDDPARLYISFVLTATNYLILMLALFISTFSLPNDIKNKTIYTVVTKPVRPTEIVLGRILGFTAVGTMLLAPMGLASYFFVTRGLDHDHGVADVVQLPDGSYEGKSTFDRNHEHTFTLDENEAGELVGFTNAARGHRHIVRREGDQYVFGPPVDALHARIPNYGELQFLDRDGSPGQGIDVGHEHIKGGYGSANLGQLLGTSSGPRRIEYGYVEGGSLGAGIFTFSDVTPQRYPERLPLEMNLRAYRAHKGVIDRGIRGTITLRNPDTDAESDPRPFEVREYGMDEQLIPLELEGTDGAVSRTLSLFDDLVTEDGRLEVVIRCIDRGQYLGMTRGDVFLKPAENSFGWNLTKAYISIWLQMLMIISFGVMFSTFLSGSVAMIATFVCVLLGFSAEMIFDIRYYMDQGKSMGGGPIESLVRTARQDAMTTELDVDSIAAAVIKGADSVIIYAMNTVATALPNLPKMLETAEFAASGFDIFGSLLARHTATTLAYCLLAFFISYFFLKAREIAA